MSRTILATAFAAVVCLFPWIIGGNYPFVRTFASALIVLLLLVSTLFSLRKSKAESGQSLQARMVLWVMVAVLGYCGLQTFFPGQIFSSELPAASRERLSELFYSIGFFLFAYHFFRNSDNIAPFAIVVFINGVLLALFGIVQQLSYNGMLFWNYELAQGGIPFSSFVNRNNAAGYLVLCFAVANFFLARHLFSHNSNQTGNGMKSRSTRISERIRIAFENMEATHLYLFSGILLIAVSVFFSQSRGGTLALIAAFLVGWIIMLKTNRLLLVAVLVLVAAGAGFVTYCDKSGEIAQRMQTLSNPEVAATPRLDHWSTVTPYISDYVATGSGLGTYAYLYPRYQQTQFTDWFRHAENQYLETLAEVGLLGLIALLATMFLMYRCCTSSKSNATDQAVSVVGLMALVGQAVAACFDFGLYLPGNTVLMATIMGLVMARHCAAVTDPKAEQATKTGTRMPARMIPVLATLLIVANAWGVYQLSAVDSRQMAAHRLRKFDPEQHIDQLGRIEDLLNHSIAVRPDDAEAHYQMGQLQVLKYRVNVAERLVEDATQARSEDREKDTSDRSHLSENRLQDSVKMTRLTNDSEDVPDAVAARGPLATDIQSVTDVWSATSLMALNRVANIALNDQTNPAAYEELVSSAEFAHLREAWDSFQLSETHCPYLYRSQFRLAELSIINDRDSSPREHIEIAISRCPLHVNLLYNAGLLEHHSGNSDAAAQYWGQVMQLTRRYDPQIILYARYEMSIKQFFEVILPQEPELLVTVANKYFRAQEDHLPRQMLLAYTRDLMFADSTTLSKPSNQFLLAFIESEFRDFENANKHFRFALEARPYDVSWRLAFARSLFAQELFSESAKNLKICLQHPDRSQAQTREIQKLLIRIEKEQQVREARRR